MTCTARAEIDGQGHPFIILMEWKRITKSSSSSTNDHVSKLNPNEYTTTGSPGSGYQSILTTTENDTVNIIIYRCRARTPTFPVGISVSDVSVTVKGMQNHELALEAYRVGSAYCVKLKTLERKYLADFAKRRLL